MSGREILLRSLSPEVVEAVEALIAATVAAELDARAGSESPWLALDEAAAYLRVSERTLERRIAGGRVRSRTIGRRRLLHRDDLDALVKATPEEEVVSTTPLRRRTGVR